MFSFLLFNITNGDLVALEGFDCMAMAFDGKFSFGRRNGWVEIDGGMG
jgi:hypothetical protein